MKIILTMLAVLSITPCLGQQSPEYVKITTKSNGETEAAHQARQEHELHQRILSANTTHVRGRR